jgi:hypothetical protein
MSEQEKIASRYSPAESNQSSTKSDDNLSDVSTSESEFVGWLPIEWLRKLLFVYLRVKQLLTQSHMNVWFLGISLVLVFTSRVKIF